MRITKVAGAVTAVLLAAGLGGALHGCATAPTDAETAAYARLASLLVWSVAASDGTSDWLTERLGEMVQWLDEVNPVLPPG